VLCIAVALADHDGPGFVCNDTKSILHVTPEPRRLSVHNRRNRALLGPSDKAGASEAAFLAPSGPCGSIAPSRSTRSTTTAASMALRSSRSPTRSSLQSARPPCPSRPVTPTPRPPTTLTLPRSRRSL